ncbi:MAG TPA: ABC transporter permease [Polyangia bacterium]|nr:ABC transporter permease [Polyangia bacterium]
MTETTPPFANATSAAPPLRRSLGFLLQADFVVQLRNRRALYISYVLPLLMLFALFAGRNLQIVNRTSRVASCITVGMAAIAIVGYTMGVARDREAGVFQRLRVTPTAPWAIMISRLAIQVLAMLSMAVVVLVAAAVFGHVTLQPAAYLLTLVVIVFCSAEFLSIGQAFVGLVKSVDTVNALSRLLLPVVAVLGLFGHSNILGTTFEMVARWSPSGVVVSMLSGAMRPATWSSTTWLALLVSVGYCAVFAGIGIRWFQWTSR